MSCALLHALLMYGGINFTGLWPASPRPAHVDPHEPPQQGSSYSSGLPCPARKLNTIMPPRFSGPQARAPWAWSRTANCRDTGKLHKAGKRQAGRLWDKDLSESTHSREPSWFERAGAARPHKTAGRFRRVAPQLQAWTGPTVPTTLNPPQHAWTRALKG